MTELRGNVRNSSLRERPFAILPGQYFDAETGLHQNWHRDYDPSIGRYLQVDPLLPQNRLLTDEWALFVPVLLDVPQWLAPYTYVTNRPLTEVDPMGLGFLGSRRRCCQWCWR